MLEGADVAFFLEECSEDPTKFHEAYCSLQGGDQSAQICVGYKKYSFEIETQPNL
jgi:hypothetical protein